MQYFQIGYEERMEGRKMTRRIYKGRVYVV